MRNLTLAVALMLTTGPAAGQSAAEQRLWDQYERALRRQAEALREQEAWRQRWKESLDEPREPAIDADRLKQQQPDYTRPLGRTPDLMPRAQ
jgi:hypothetical protein